jgi:hypothetical protein
MRNRLRADDFRIVTGYQHHQQNRSSAVTAGRVQ